LNIIINQSKTNYGFASNNNVLTNALLVNLSDPFGTENRSYIVLNPQTEGIPSDMAWGVREVLYINKDSVIARITGIKLNGSTTSLWVNAYNYGNWVGWREL
jgi:hypothetical protein